ncbi:heterokaryon incompatibility protein-domain-containing protein [Phaeosphaeria sp. MPI-PUGE-AT-0046c]|nr:heterokaryon incompatibility protein-domain-containing protein [Phaeosphaeria sp. MPI-PUGE-AT-0046c]
MAAFHYEPLSLLDTSAVHQAKGLTQSSIRLLELLPGLNSEDLCCRIAHTSLSHRAGYEALSYTWGSPHRTHRIQCNDGYLYVTTTLRDALTILRYAKKSRTLWIDQLCINQEDVEERNSQVRIMHLIYRHATRIIVFLAVDDASEPALQISRRAILRELRKAHVDGEGPTLQELRKLFSQPWFQRVWILQEVGMSDVEKIVFYYKSFKISWDDVRGAASLYSSYLPGEKYNLVQLPPSVVRHGMIMSKWTALGPGQFQFATLDRYAHLYFRTNTWWYSMFLIAQEPRLVEMLQDSRFCLATDPRDKIYSLLNMLRIDSTKDPSSELLKIDYSLSAATVYIRAARHSIENESSLEILCYKEGISAMNELPSWVPDWTQQRLFPMNRIALVTHYRSQFHVNAWPTLLPLRSTKNKVPVAAFSSDERKITVKARFLDTCQVLSAAWTANLDVADDELFKQWANIYTGGMPHEITKPSSRKERAHAGVRVTPHSICDFWLRVGRHQRLKSSDTLNPFYSDHPAQKEWRKCCYHRHRRGRSMMLHRRGNISILAWHDWLAMMLPYASVGRCVSVTDNGFFLLVPQDTLPGDMIFFLEGGGGFGFALRRENDSTEYVFVGVVYVHGFYGTNVPWKSGFPTSVTIK